jgi:hypothetical protein
MRSLPAMMLMDLTAIIPPSVTVRDITFHARARYQAPEKTAESFQESLEFRWDTVWLEITSTTPQPISAELAWVRAVCEDLFTGDFETLAPLIVSQLAARRGTL